MTKRMLIDATHAEETRVVVLDGSRLEDFDVETSTKASSPSAKSTPTIIRYRSPIVSA
jgi:Ribonuclease G/E